VPSARNRGRGGVRSRTTGIWRRGGATGRRGSSHHAEKRCFYGQTLITPESMLRGPGGIRTPEVTCISGTIRIALPMFASSGAPRVAAFSLSEKRCFALAQAVAPRPEAFLFVSLFVLMFIVVAFLGLTRLATLDLHALPACRIAILQQKFPK